ncbi:hypothetical protein SEA_MARIOKART_28 [Gordonia phage Mariokart]|nr:hypothetical protein SEA_MARIOKART_28 [Gordonia phage Mariokart]
MTEPTEEYEIVTAEIMTEFRDAPEGSALWFSFADPDPVTGAGRCVITEGRHTPPDDGAMFLTGKPGPGWEYWDDPQAAADYYNALILGQ